MTFKVHQMPAMGAEDVVVGLGGKHEGAVFTGTEDGSIYRLSHDGARVDRVAHTGGRPLGIEVDPDGRLLVCDAHRGVLRVDPDSGGVEQLTDRVNGVKMMFCNNAAIATSGDVWFSDSSKHFSIEKWKDDFVQNTRTGRLLVMRPDGRVEVKLERLAFANGVALARGESYVAVAETGARTVARLWLTGAKAGQRDFLATDLPGYPDNIARGSDGLIWVTIASPTDAVVERLQQAPMWVRRQVTRIPERAQPKPKRTVRAQAFDDTGALVHDVDVETSDYHMATGVREHDGRVWFGSLHEPAVAVVDL
ncbi:SMP-30/gluconolactonase/LRE family protein [Nocardioides speluncae]|uniref:SMP-30/gluconolactonase/LRE family protein n=1 Tax=Nocardioides speluncae TaxID=2670337 RepID=UPI000D68D6A5|nr:SMP-30/gluconolactonase/LRE family protein [Nocardioides speluncae]